jgi:hypothetical protein
MKMIFMGSDDIASTQRELFQDILVGGSRWDIQLGRLLNMEASCLETSLLARAQWAEIALLDCCSRYEEVIGDRLGQIII